MMDQLHRDTSKKEPARLRAAMRSSHDQIRMPGLAHVHDDFCRRTPKGLDGNLPLRKIRLDAVARGFSESLGLGEAALPQAFRIQPHHLNTKRRMQFSA